MMTLNKLFIIFISLIPINAFASSVNFEKGIFEFNGIATLAIIAGVYCIHLGYKIISNGKSDGNIDIDVDIPEKGRMTVSGATSGVAFMIFGAFIIVAGVLGNIRW